VRAIAARIERLAGATPVSQQRPDREVGLDSIVDVEKVALQAAV
jgi:hypothetical protein